MQVLVLHYGADDQDVLQQADDAQNEEDLRGDIELLTDFGFSPSWWSFSDVQGGDLLAGVAHEGPGRGADSGGLGEVHLAKVIWCTVSGASCDSVARHL